MLVAACVQCVTVNRSLAGFRPSRTFPTCPRLPLPPVKNGVDIHTRVSVSPTRRASSAASHPHAHTPGALCPFTRPCPHTTSHNRTERANQLAVKSQQPSPAVQVRTPLPLQPKQSTSTARHTQHNNNHVRPQTPSRPAALGLCRDNNPHVNE